jgi:hypothetical protein
MINGVQNLIDEIKIMARIWDLYKQRKNIAASGIYNRRKVNIALALACY